MIEPNSFSHIDPFTVYDKIPLVSTATNLYCLYIKASIALGVTPSNLDHRDITYYKEKNVFRCLVLLIPGLGNLAVYLYDHYNKRLPSQGKEKHESPFQAPAVPTNGAMSSKTPETLTVSEPFITVAKDVKISAWSQDQKEAASRLSCQPWFLKDAIPGNVQPLTQEMLLGAHHQALIDEQAFADLLNDQKTFEIAYDPHLLPPEYRAKISHLMTDTLVSTYNADRNVMRPNGSRVSFRGNCQTNPGNQTLDAYDKQLLTDEERVLKRASIITSAYVTNTARGGMDALERTPHTRTFKVLYMHTSGIQFGKFGCSVYKSQFDPLHHDTNELDVSLFVIKPGAKANPTPIIDYFGGQGIPAYDGIKKDQCNALGDGNFDKDYATFFGGYIFNRKAYRESMSRYLNDLVLPTITQRTKQQPFYLKATLFGGEDFSQMIHPETKIIAYLQAELRRAMLRGYINALETDKIPKDSVIEFPYYGEIDSIAKTLIALASQKGVKIVWSPEGDICDYTQQKTVELDTNSNRKTGTTVDPQEFEKKRCLVVLGAGNDMAWAGNESESWVIDPMFANNSNLRLVMNWWANPTVFEQINQISQIAVSPQT